MDPLRQIHTETVKNTIHHSVFVLKQQIIVINCSKWNIYRLQHDSDDNYLVKVELWVLQ